MLKYFLYDKGKACLRTSLEWEIIVFNHNKYSCFDCLNSPVGPLQIHIHKEDGRFLLLFMLRVTCSICVFTKFGKIYIKNSSLIIKERFDVSVGFTLKRKISSSNQINLYCVFLIFSLLKRKAANNRINMTMINLVLSHQSLETGVV